MKRLHSILSWIVQNPYIQLIAGLTLFIYTLIDEEQSALHHGVRFLVIWRAVPDIVQAIERITRGFKE